MNRLAGPSPEIEPFLSQVVRWAQARPDILAVALVGSHARGAARPDSDIDLVLLIADPAPYLANPAWVSRFGRVEKQRGEPYGPLTSLRVWYAGGPEVEYGLTTPAWAAQPLDDGTARVIRDGLRVLFEREPLLSPLTHLSR